jgi:hypothetical protein
LLGNIRVAAFYYTVHRIEDRQAVVHDSRLLPENRATLDYCPAEWVTGLRLRSDNDRCGRHAQRSHRSLHGSPTPVSDCCIYSFNEKRKTKRNKKICLDAVEYIVYSSQFWAAQFNHQLIIKFQFLISSYIFFSFLFSGTMKYGPCGIPRTIDTSIQF